MSTSATPLPHSPTLPRILPFVVYMAFIALWELGDMTGLLPADPAMVSLSYPIKAGCTALALVFCLRLCPEVRFSDLRRLSDTGLAVLTGTVVFVIWIQLDQPWATLGQPVAFDPEVVSDGPARTAFLACRLAGAAIVVPFAEEIFWRSWLIRTVQAKDFLSVPLNKPHLFSFAAVNILFALEHHMIVAGLIAGVLYTFLLYRTNSVMQCILAHAVTNAILGGWVLVTGSWNFW